ncbi:MAG: NADH:flavin oxidoreductase [Desulfobacteraceae bacterium]
MTTIDLPLKIGKMVIRNRVIMAPMRTNMINMLGGATPALKKHLCLRAIGGCGMIILESGTVDYLAGGHSRCFRMDRDHLDNFDGLLAHLHCYRVKVAAQLWHAGPRADIHRGDPVSPSGSIPGFPGARPLTTDEISLIVEKFIVAGSRAVAAGADALEIHAAHGYLLHHFISDVTNKRKDRYGGSVTNRYRIIAEIKKGLAINHPHIPLFLRLSLNENDDFRSICKSINMIGFDAVDIRTGFSSLPKNSNRIGYTLPIAKNIRPYIKVPILTGGHILTPEQAGEALNTYQIDAVVLGRALLADAEWFNKAIKGENINYCQYDCMPSCYSEFKKGEELKCQIYQQ